MARGALISKQANRERISPSNTSNLKPFSKSFYYGLGILVQNEWQFQNPFIDGYTGLAAYLPSQQISLGIVTTQLPQSSANEVGNAGELFAKLSEYLSPAHTVRFKAP
jgi:hypothetical protein